MPEDKEYTTVDLEYASVYEYVEKKYRDAWEKEELSGQHNIPVHSPTRIHSRTV